VQKATLPQKRPTSATTTTTMGGKTSWRRRGATATTTFPTLLVQLSSPLEGRQ